MFRISASPAKELPPPPVPLDREYYHHPLIPQDSLESLICDVGPYLDEFGENLFLIFCGAGWGTTWPVLRMPSEKYGKFAFARGLFIGRCVRRGYLGFQLHLPIHFLCFLSFWVLACLYLPMPQYRMLLYTTKMDCCPTSLPRASQVLHRQVFICYVL